MANALFNRGRQAFLNGEIAWSTDNIKVVCVDHALDTPVVATDEDLDDISTGVVFTSANLDTKTVTNGVAGAANLTLTAVGAGDPFESLVIYWDSGTSSTSLLIAYIDNATGLPFTPTGADILITWDTGANKIFKL